MPPRLLAAAALALATLAAPLFAGAQTADPNLQNLLSALTSGSEVMLVTPLRSGMVQVTSFQPGGRLSAPEAVTLIEQARTQLQALGEPQPTAEEIARMLAGGPIEIPSGRIHAPGLLATAGRPATIRSQVVAAGTPLPSTAGPSAAAGGTAPPSARVATRELALQQLAALGILNPSEDQIRTALVGGPIMTLNGVYELPGILPR
ncbi:MAG TPA: hypothetical protein VM183_14535 [Burkholderiales bacterium]|nr:hypothetical protein [Burkholderiales bacterium]